MARKYRILLVDDNEAIHSDIKSILINETALAEAENSVLAEELFGDDARQAEEEDYVDYQIDDAFQGEEAVTMVDKAYAENFPYSWIFMDVRMPPGIDGIQSIKKIWEKHPRIEIVICTAFSDYSLQDIKEELGNKNTFLFLTKPFDTIALKQIALTLTAKWQLKQNDSDELNLLKLEIRELKMIVADLSEKLSNIPIVIKN